MKRFTHPTISSRDRHDHASAHAHLPEVLNFATPVLGPLVMSELETAQLPLTWDTEFTRIAAREIMPGIEALYVVQFGDIPTRGRTLRNGGVVVLETNRIFGGDSGYYYVGSYEVKGSQLEGNIKVVKHNPAFENVFGDAVESFNASVKVTVTEGIMNGFMERQDRQGQPLPVRLIWKENLP